MKTTPSISWTTPAAIAYGTALSAMQLDATASVAGTFVYYPASGTVPKVGTQTLSATFTPTDATMYNTATASVALTVNPAIPGIVWATPATVPVGTVLGSAQLDAASTVPGAFVYSPAAGTVLSTAGNVMLSTTFTPTDTTDYTVAKASVTLIVQAAPPPPPTYAWGNVKIVAGGYVPGLYFHPTQQGLMYARTDIGGAYRWGPNDKQWVPLLDFVSPTTWWYGGVEAIGLDPTDANRLYLAVGEYALETYDGDGAMLVSDDQGKTFTTVPLSFRNGSNDSGRNAGERIAVDANLPATVYFGTRLAGLQISTDHGSTWKAVTGLPVTKTANGSGVVSVVPIPSSGSSGMATPVVYAAVAGTGTSGDPVGLYVTTQGGSTTGAWVPVTGQPSFTGATVPLAPLHAVTGPDGTLYVLYADQPGPYGITTSQLWEFKPGSARTSGTWKQITIPANTAGNTGESGYGAITVDPSHAGVLLLATIDQYYPGDTLYRSVDDGATWVDVSAKGGTHDGSLSPYLAFGGPADAIGSGNWVGSAVIDPFDSDHAMYGTGATIWATTNLTEADTEGTVAWAVGADGVEETSVGYVLAPPTGNTLLLSSMGDIYGFAHQDLTKSPPQGMFTNPMATPSGMDFEQATPTTVVRVTDGQYGATPLGSTSLDGGLTWTAFKSVPAGTKGGGSVAIAPDGSSLVWAPEDTASVWYSTNAGASWTAAAGVAAQAQVASDRVKAGVYYAYAGSSFYLSTNGGATWAAVQSNLPTGMRLTILPEAQGDLWLAGNGKELYHYDSAATSPVLQPTTVGFAVNHFGFGASSPASNHPALYFDGTISTTGYGIYRSVDGGLTWTQINDATHQFGGGIQSIMGDMRTFGTVYISTNGRGIIWGTEGN